MPEGHNGGPPLEPRRNGRPTKLTPEVEEAIMDALFDGVPIRAMATVPGFPHPVTIRRWRATNLEFARSFAFAQQEGWINLADLVKQEADANLERHGVARARWVFSRRTHSLAQQAPAAFGRDR